jgi:hypothetical protein
MGGWVGPRASLETEATGKPLSPLPGINRPVVHPVARHYTDWATRLTKHYFYVCLTTTCYYKSRDIMTGRATANGKLRNSRNETARKIQTKQSALTRHCVEFYIATHDKIPGRQNRLPGRTHCYHGYEVRPRLINYQYREAVGIKQHCAWLVPLLQYTVSLAHFTPQPSHQSISLLQSLFLSDSLYFADS